MNRLIIIQALALSLLSLASIAARAEAAPLLTCANIDDLARDAGFRPGTPIETGLRRFVEWYRRYYNIA